MENKRGYVSAEVIENEKIASNVYKLKVKGKYDAKPGQFYMLRAWGNYPLLSRPISVYDVDDISITFVYMVVGEGTRLISEKKIGEKIELLGALGNGFDIDKKYGKVALVGGGIGIAPLLYLAKEIKADEVDFIAGFRDEVYELENFAKYTNVKVATEDGSHGVKGYVTNLLPENYYDVIFTCGPMPMIKAVKEKVTKGDLYVSLEAYMGCGMGVCLGCQVVTADGEVLRICKEGPVFKASEVKIDD